jgi:hypothetical protein
MSNLPRRIKALTEELCVIYLVAQDDVTPTQQLARHGHLQRR